LGGGDDDDDKEEDNDDARYVDKQKAAFGCLAEHWYFLFPIHKADVMILVPTAAAPKPMDGT
jgi:hypothetical protein